jgi:hypothetical protein
MAFIGFAEEVGLGPFPIFTFITGSGSANLLETNK